MIRLAEEAFSEIKGVAIFNGKFIGPLMIISAKNTLLRNALIETKRK